MADERVRVILDEAWSLFQAKNKLYAGNEESSSLTLLKLSGMEPWEGTVVILADKTARLLNLRKANDPELSQTIKDTFMDLINYSAMGLQLYEQSCGTGQGNTKREKRDRPKTQRARRKRPIQSSLPFHSEDPRTEQAT
jgi:hypothetical protein